MRVSPDIGITKPPTRKSTPSPISPNPIRLQRVIRVDGLRVNQPRRTTSFSSALRIGPIREFSDQRRSRERLPLPRACCRTSPRWPAGERPAGPGWGLVAHLDGRVERGREVIRLHLADRSRFWKAIRPVLASSIRTVSSECWVAFPWRTTVASGGAMSAGGPAIRIDRSRAPRGRYLAAPREEGEPDHHQRVTGAPIRPSTAFACRRG